MKERMDQFDDMLRNNMANPAPETRFEFREEYWLQAERLLEADERRRRRGLLFWWFGAGALALAGAMWVFWPQEASPNPSPASHTPAPVEKAMAATQAQSTPLVFSPQKNMPAQATESQNTVSNSLYNNRQHQTKNQENNAQVVIFERPLPENTTAVREKRTNSVVIADNPVSAPVPMTFFYDHTSNVAVETSPTLMMPAAQVLFPSRPLKEVSSTSPLQAIQSTNTAEIPVAPVKVHRAPKKLQMGLLAAVGTPSGLFDVEKPGVGLGGTTRYRLNRHFSVNADLVWRRWKGQNFENSNNLPGAFTGNYFDSQSVSNNLVTYDVKSNYSFGVTNIRSAIERQSLHLIELPVALQWHFGRLTLEGGVSSSLVLASRSVLREYSSGSLDHNETPVGKEVLWSNSTGLKRLQSGLFTGISWEPSRHWSVGLRGWYQTAKGIGNNYDIEQAGNLAVPASSKGLSGIDVRLRYFF